MTKQEQIQLVIDLTASISEDIVVAITNNAPPHWDGAQIRQYIVDQFADKCMPGRFMCRTDVREYETDCVKFNL